MNDLHRFLALLDDFGVEYKIALCPPIHYIPFSAGRYSVRMNEGMRNVDGYASFYTRYEFDSDGSFQIMGAWE